jgi:hypothetical protein
MGFAEELEVRVEFLQSVLDRSSCSQNHIKSANYLEAIGTGKRFIEPEMAQ